ncbi:chemerin-like receptor 1 [Paramormyrops kingsleyae]|uniref:chemerin-like receptor 1 n=1 Tax=Paramormyrops kingsleyae TaxID=1676925 RepID=UPI003B9716CF
MEQFDFEEYSNDYENYTYNYTSENTTLDHVVFHHHRSCRNDLSCIIVTIVNTIICLLGIFGNGVVIWIAGLKMVKSVNTTWYLSLAISDFLFCLFLPINAAYIVTRHWIFGLYMCKITSFVMFLNMFSSIFLLVFISIDRCVSVVFPVWSQNQRTVRKAFIMVTLAWIVSIALSSPSAVFRKTKVKGGRTECYNDYELSFSHSAVVFSRFVCGFLLPFLIIISCYSVIICKLRSSRMTKSSKPFKVMSALIAAFFICWLPFHTFVLLELNHNHYNIEFLKAGLTLGTSFASANSFLNPILYVFMGKDFKHKFKSSLLSKIENAMGEEVRTTSRYFSRSSSMDGRASAHL